MFQGTSFHLVDAVVTGQQLLAIVTAAVLTAGFELVRRGTLFGKIGMATAADPEMATAVGVNTTVVAIVAFAASAFYAGVAGLLIGPTTFANPYLGDTFGTFGFIAMMIGGGTEKPIAAMFGGLLLGVCAEGANAMINSQASDWFPFIVLVVVLIVSPRGLFSAGNLFRLARARRCLGAGLRAAVETERIEAPRATSALAGAGFKPRLRTVGVALFVAAYVAATAFVAHSDLGVQSLVLVAAVFGILAISLDLVAGMLGPLLAGPGRLLRHWRLFHDDRRQQSQLERLPRPSDRAPARRPHRARGRRDVAEGQRALFRDHHIHFHARADGVGDRSQDHRRAARIAWPRISRLSGGSRGARRARSLGASCSLCSCASASFGAFASRRSIRCSWRFATPNASRRQLARALRLSRSACSASPPRWLAPPDGCSRSSASFRPVNSIGRCP